MMPERDPFNDNTSWGTSTGLDVPAGVSDAAGRLSEKVKSAGRATADRLERTRHNAADVLDRAADKLHRGADHLGSGRTGSMAHNTAASLESTAHYLHEHDARAMVGDLEGVIRRYPAQAMVSALAVGFLIGRSLRRDRY